MDNAVALVRAYLQVNGYFTVAEYPVIEAVEAGGYRTITDLDILAFRFPRSGRLIPGANNQPGPSFAPDPALGVLREHADLLIGEIKEGVAELNRGARNPAVLRVALRRFGCCSRAEVAKAAESLLERGRARLASGYRVRLVAFGTFPPTETEPGYQVMLLGRVADFLQNYIREHWDVLRHAQFKDRAFGLMVTLEKARRGQ